MKMRVIHDDTASRRRLADEHDGDRDDHGREQQAPR
jgi:hypothetical protein